MPEVIHSEISCEVPFPKADLWPILSKTDWINRAAGLPPVEYDIRPLPQGGSEVTARAKMFGLEMRWKEIPFEWIEGAYYSVHRIFESGPLAEGRMGLTFAETGPKATKVTAFSDLKPRHALGGWLVRRILAPRTNAAMKQIVEHVGESLRGRKPAAIPKLPRKPVSEAALQAGLRKLTEMTGAASLVSGLERMLREAPDVELSHIRPFAVARVWNQDRWDILRLFLQATRAGLLDFSWEVLCPNCRSTRLPRATSLDQVKRGSHCEVCQIQFDAQFDKSVELKFSVNPNVRPCDSQTFCLAGPGGKPHVFSQLLLEPGETRPWKFPPAGRSCKVRSPQVKTPLVLGSGDEPDGRACALHCRPERFELKSSPSSQEPRGFEISNSSSFQVQVVFEALDWSEEILTAAQVTNWQEFRDLFDTQVISPNEQITVGAQIVLFTDLRGSTAMYNGIGDVPAYVVVRDHFEVLTKAIRDHHGAIVKTIGDAVMAVFSRVDEALEAVLEMHTGLHRALPADGMAGNLKLKSSLHLGPCLAVNANDKLDYFGTTINLAARMVSCCHGGDLTISDDLYQRSETAQFLASSGKSAEPAEVQFRGFDNAHRVWRIPMETRVPER